MKSSVSHQSIADALNSGTGLVFQMVSVHEIRDLHSVVSLASSFKWVDFTLVTQQKSTDFVFQIDFPQLGLFDVDPLPVSLVSGVHTNFCLFMPIYDWLGGTLDPKSWDLFFKAASGTAVSQVNNQMTEFELHGCFGMVAYFLALAFFNFFMEFVLVGFCF